MSDYELKRINALTEASAIGDDDVFALDSVNGTKKVKWSTIDGKVGDKVDGMLATATVPNAEQLIAHTGVTDTEPYKLRASKSIGDRAFDTLVGGSLGWNQLLNKDSYPASSGIFTNNGDGSVTASGTPESTSSFVFLHGNVFIYNHVYYVYAGNKDTGSSSTFELMITHFFGPSQNLRLYGEATVTRFTGEAVIHDMQAVVRAGVTANNLKWRPQLIDLTTLFGATIADYIYSLEQATAGAGVAWVRRYLTADYYAFCAPKLEHVTGVSAHVMRDANDNVIGNYAIDSTWVGMGIPKLDASNKLYFDGDIYPPSGQCTNRYGIVDLGTLNYTRVADSGGGYYFLSDIIPTLKKQGGNYDVWSNLIIGGNYDKVASATMTTGAANDKTYGGYDGGAIRIKNDAYSDAASLKASLSGTYLVYEKATPTASSATPFTSPQICDPNGTEEYVTTGLVPVGHETLYPIDIRGTIETISETPTEDGTYTLKCTVSGGVPTMEWVSE